MKRIVGGLFIAVGGMLAVAQPEGIASIGTLRFDDKAALVHHARLALEAAAHRRAAPGLDGDRAPFEGPLTPVRCTIRRDGRLVASGYAGSTDLGDATARCVLDAIARAPKKQRPKKRQLPSLRIELHIPDPVELRARLAFPGLKAKYDPGFMGIGARMDDKFVYEPAPVAYQAPSDLASLTETLARRVGQPRGAAFGDAVTFTTASEIHLVETDPAGGWIELRRGLRIDTPEIVETGDLLGSVRLGLDWLVRHQRENGSYQQRYYAFERRFSSGQEMFRQALAAHAVSIAALRLQDGTLKASAARCLDFILQRLRRLPVAPDKATTPSAHYLHDTNHAHTGTTALALVALATLDADRYAETIRSMATALAGQVDAEGRLHTSFLDPDDDHLDSDHVGPSLYALAAIYRRTGMEALAAPLERAFAYYQRQWERHKTREAIAWQTRASYEMYLATEQLTYADWVFDMQDFILRVAWTPQRAKRPDYLGGIGRKPPGADTADYLVGTAEAYELARRVGDEPRRRFYGSVCRIGSRFLTRLQVKPEEPFYLSRSEQLFMLGGFRGSLIEHDLPLESTASVTLALLEVRELAPAMLGAAFDEPPTPNPFDDETDLESEVPHIPAPDSDQD